MELSEAWRMSNEVNLFLLGKLPDEYLGDRYSARARTVAAQFAHLHNVRLRCLSFTAHDLADGLSSFPRGANPTKQQLLSALQASEVAISRLLDRCVERGKVPSWKGPPASFLAYLVAHEAHHRGLAMVAIRLCDHKLPREVVYGQWDWGKKRSLR